MARPQPNRNTVLTRVMLEDKRDPNPKCDPSRALTLTLTVTLPLT